MISGIGCGSVRLRGSSRLMSSGTERLRAALGFVPLFLLLHSGRVSFSSCSTSLHRFTQQGDKEVAGWAGDSCPSALP